MANKKQPTKAGATNKKAKWAGFVNVYLSKQEKGKIRDNTLTDFEAFQFIIDAAEKGYKFSASYSEAGKFFSVTLYGSYENRPNAGYAMSLKHSHFLTAITALHHCVEQAGIDGDWSDRYTTAEGHDW